jgi:hypothetical protein
MVIIVCRVSEKNEIDSKMKLILDGAELMRTAGIKDCNHFYIPDLPAGEKNDCII